MQTFNITGHSNVVASQIVSSAHPANVIEIIDGDTQYMLYDNGRSLTLKQGENVVMVFDYMTNKITIECSDFNGVVLSSLLIQVLFS